MYVQATVGCIPLLLRFHGDTKGIHTSLDKEKEIMSSTKLYRLSGISLLLGAVVSIIAGFITLFFDSSLTASPSTIQSPLWSPYWGLVFVVLVLVVMGLPALYLRQALGRGGLLGLIGVFLVVLGSFLGMAMVAYFVSIMPLLAEKAPNLINAGFFETSFGVFGLSSSVLSVIGPLLLGIAVIRAKVFPPLVGALLIVSAILSPSTEFAGLLFTLLGLVGTIAAAIAYGRVGMILMQQPKAVGAEVSSPPQAVLR
jgi:hypothetical protein